MALTLKEERCLRKIIYRTLFSHDRVSVCDLSAAGAISCASSSMAHDAATPTMDRDVS